MTPDDQVIADFAEMGVTVETENVPHDGGEFSVYPTAWDSICAFLACETQWRVAAGLAGLVWIGLDYAGADVVLRRRRSSDDTFEDLQLMEAEALSILNGGAN